MVKGNRVDKIRTEAPSINGVETSSKDIQKVKEQAVISKKNLNQISTSKQQTGPEQGATATPVQLKQNTIQQNNVDTAQINNQQPLNKGDQDVSMENNFDSIGAKPIGNPASLQIKKKLDQVQNDATVSVQINANSDQSTVLTSLQSTGLDSLMSFDGINRQSKVNRKKNLSCLAQVNQQTQEIIEKGIFSQKGDSSSGSDGGGDDDDVVLLDENGNEVAVGMKDQNSEESDNDGEDGDSGKEEEKSTRKKINKVTLAHKRLLVTLSNGHTQLYGDVQAKLNSAFDGCSKGYMRAVKSHCNNQYHKKNKQLGRPKIPRPLDPNPVLMDLFSCQDQELVWYLVGTLETCGEKKIISYIEMEYVKSKVRLIQNFSNPVEAQVILLKVHDNVKVKAVLYAIQIFLDLQLQNEEELGRAWFNICLEPALVASLRHKIEDFTYQEVSAMQKISNSISFVNVSQVAVILYCQILISQNLFSFDTICNKLGERDQNFWVNFLASVCGYSPEFSLLCYESKEGNLMTDIIYKHHAQVRPTIQFYQLAVLFQPLSDQNLIKLGEMSANMHIYGMFFELMPKDQLQDFSAFQTAVQILAKFTNHAQRQNMHDMLAGLQLSQWAAKEKMIHCSVQFDKPGQNCLKLIQQTFEEFGQVEGVEISTPSMLKTWVHPIWEKAFALISKKIQLTKLDWQVDYSEKFYSLVKAGYSIICFMGTGHGKTMLIEVQATMSAIEGKRVIIVYLNEYLAFWSAQIYGSIYVEKQLVRHVSLKRFLLIPPEKNTLVIFDEIDRTIGSNSFQIKELSPNKFTAFYLPTYLQNWGQIIGFSGTMGTSCVQQIRYSFPQALHLVFPSLRKYGGENKLVEVVQIKNAEDLAPSIGLVIEKYSKTVENFIIICDNEVALNSIEKFVSAQVSQHRQIITVPSFEVDPTEIALKLTRLKDDPFIAVTSQEGGIAVDWGGVGKSLSLIAYTPKTVSETSQCIGRSSRNLEQAAEGIIISLNPFQKSATDYLARLQMKEQYQNIAFLLNSRLASGLHGKVVEGSAYLAMLWVFEQFYQTSKETSEKDRQLYWSHLKKIIADPTMPDNINSTWILQAHTVQQHQILGLMLRSTMQEAFHNLSEDISLVNMLVDY